MAIKESVLSLASTFHLTRPRCSVVPGETVTGTWRGVGRVLGRVVDLDTIVWPGGDLVVPGLSARARSVFRIVTALAPPFVMEAELDEDGQCLRGLPCHRLLTRGKDNLTLVFSELETQEREEAEDVVVSEVNGRTSSSIRMPAPLLAHSCNLLLSAGCGGRARLPPGTSPGTTGPPPPSRRRGRMRAAAEPTTTDTSCRTGGIPKNSLTCRDTR